jgi:hypothetical protein
MWTRYKADALFVDVFLELIYAVPFGMNSPSRKSEPTGSACSQPAWKMSLSQSILLAEIMLPKSVTCFFTIAYTFSKLNTDLKFDMSGCYVGKLLGFSSGIWRRVVW